jgi:hypothetical protein
MGHTSYVKYSKSSINIGINEIAQSALEEQ